MKAQHFVINFQIKPLFKQELCFDIQQWDILLEMFLGTVYLLQKYRKCYPWFLGTCITNPRSWSFFSCGCKNRFEKSDTCRCDYSYFPALKMCISHTFSASARPLDLKKDKLCVLWHALITRTKKRKLHDAIYNLYLRSAIVTRERTLACG